MKNPWLFALCVAGCSSPPAAPGPADAKDLRVAVAQPLVVPGDVRENINRMEPLVVEAARQGARLIVFSECGLTGWDFNGTGAAAALALDDPALARVDRIAAANRITIVNGFFERHPDGTLRNTLVAFQPDGKRAVQRKNVVTPGEIERGVVSSPMDRAMFDVGSFRFGLVICADAGLPNVHEDIVKRGGQGIIISTAGCGSTDQGMKLADLDSGEKRRKYAEMSAKILSEDSIRRCLDLGLAQIACNQSGLDLEARYFHPGGSSIIDGTGAVGAALPCRFVFEHLRPDLAVTTISR